MQPTNGKAALMHKTYNKLTQPDGQVPAKGIIIFPGPKIETTQLEVPPEAESGRHLIKRTLLIFSNTGPRVAADTSGSMRSQPGCVDGTSMNPSLQDGEYLCEQTGV
jgi:hypothetical protein